MAKYGEGVVCILGVPVIDGQADWCCPSCQCTSNSICSGLSRLGDELLWHWIWGHFSGADNGQIGKNLRRGVIQKWLYLGNCQSDLLQNLTKCSWGCALPLGGIIYMAMMSWGAYWCMKHTQGVFLAEKQGKIQPVFPWCPVSCITVIQWYFLLSWEKQCSKESRVPWEAVLCTNGCHHDVLCSVAVNDDTSRLT